MLDDESDFGDLGTEEAVASSTTPGDEVRPHTAEVAGFIKIGGSSQIAVLLGLEHCRGVARASSCTPCRGVRVHRKHPHRLPLATRVQASMRKMKKNVGNAFCHRC